MYQPVADHNDRQTSMHAMLPSWHTSPHDKDFDSSMASSQNSARQRLSSAATSLTKSSTRLQSQDLFNGEQMVSQESTNLSWPRIDDGVAWSTDAPSSISSENWCWDAAISHTEASSGIGVLIDDHVLLLDSAEDDIDQLMSGIQNTGRPASPMDRLESSPSGNASRSSTLSSKPSELCTCMQQLTAGLFELSELRVEHRSNAPHMEAGDFLGIHNKFLHTWERLVHECGAHMAEPQFVQLLILNIEQLVSIYNEQESWREASSAGLSGDTITVGGLVIDNSSERQAVVDALLQIKASRLADFINHLLESFSETVAPDLPARLESCLSKLMRPRAPTD
ncbi:hypothetical protein E8E14_004683 [Neopestalotiopsis sp. 37M]|nr:hypothetical protein E8E14_004683 [Neopestalotiopsis sp. 37M]